MTPTPRLLAALALTATAACTTTPARQPDPPPLPPTTSAAAPPSTPAGSPPTPLPAAFLGMRSEFYGVLRGRLAAFDARTGTRKQWLTDPPAGAVDGSPIVVEDDSGRGLVFVRSRPGSPCGTTRVLRVALATLRTTEVFRPRPSVVVTAVSISGERLVYTFTACSGDPRPRLRLVDLRSGAVITAARSSFQGNGVVSISAVRLVGLTVTVTMGIHQQLWLTRFEGLNIGGVERELDDMERLPMPNGCRPGSMVTVSRRGDGLRWGSLAVHTTLTCIEDDGYVLRYATYFGDPDRSPEIGPPFATDPEFSDLTGSDGVHLIGLRGSDDGTAYVRRVFQVAGTEERSLGDCTDVDGTADACVTEPVW